MPAETFSGKWLEGWVFFGVRPFARNLSLTLLKLPFLLASAAPYF